MINSCVISSAFTLMIYYCCIQYLSLQVISSAACSSSDECANLGSNTYPFSGSASCAASPSYVLSNCNSSSSSHAYWDSFSAAAHGVVGPPAVTSIISYSISYVDAGSPPITISATIQLSWNKSLVDECAPPFSSKNLSQYNIPSSISLTAFNSVLDGFVLEFSPDTTYLLFNCTNYDASDVVPNLESESSSCLGYKSLCPSLLHTRCIQWTVAHTDQLPLQHVLDTLSCSTFTFGSVDRFEWRRGSIELLFSNQLMLFPSPSPTGGLSDDPDFYQGFFKCNHCNAGATIAILVVLGAVVLALALVAKYCGGRIRKAFFIFIKAIIPIAINLLKRTLRKLQTSSYGPKASLHTIDLEGLTERPMEYSYNSIASATKSFSSLVGEGGFGVVYKGTVPQASSHAKLDVQVAVKVLEVRSKHIKKQFLNEVITIGRIHHVNVVRLLGFCMQEDHEMLVYEYVENGSLDRWLFDKQGEDQKQVLDWGQRYAIALGIARGLSYLHEECRHRTVHCDIKPQNILLDGEMCPKIADFGLARLMSRDESKVVTIAKGTPGYMAPEFWKGGESELSTKFDVYSYGMVLLELIGGQRNFRRGASTASSFPAAAFKAAMQGDLESILDARLGITKDTSEADEAQKLQWHQVRTAAFVALWCIQDHPESRPCMSEVVKYLEGGLAVSNCPPQPTIAISSTSFIPQRFLSSHRHIHDDVSRFASGR